MIYQEKTKDLVAEYTSLSLALDKLLERKEKNWGCFQVTKEKDFYSLYIPSLPSFKLYQNTKSIVYRGYWRQEKGLPVATDTKSFPPDLWIKKKQKKVTRSNKTNIVQKQRIFEIVYRYNPAVEIRMINQLVADFLKEKITSSIVSVPENEIFPLVLVGQPQ